VLDQQARGEEAVALLRKLVEAGTRDAHLHARLGHLLRRQGDLAGAERALRRAVELAPSVPGFHAQLADVLKRQGRDGEAAAILAA
jgi:Flp pilus assembly protein TadD